MVFKNAIKKLKTLVLVFYVCNYVKTFKWCYIAIFILLFFYHNQSFADLIKFNAFFLIILHKGIFF